MYTYFGDDEIFAQKRTECKPFIERGFEHINERKWAEANMLFEEAKQICPLSAEVLYGLFLAKHKVQSLAQWEGRYMNDLNGMRTYNEHLYPSAEHIKKMVKECVIPGEPGLDAKSINQRYHHVYVDYESCLEHVEDLAHEIEEEWEVSELSDVEESAEIFLELWDDVFSKLCESEYPEKELAPMVKSSRERMMGAANKFLQYAEKMEETNRKAAYSELEKLIKAVDDELYKKRDEALKRREIDGKNKNTDDVPQKEEVILTPEQKRALEEQRQQEYLRYRKQVEREMEMERQQAREDARRRVKRFFKTLLILVVLALIPIGYYGYKNVYRPQKTYKAAEQQLAEGNDYEAAFLFGSLGDYRDANARSMELWYSLRGERTISLSTLYTGHAAALTEEGRVLTAGRDDINQVLLPREWSGVRSILCGDGSTYGFLDDGSILYANEYSDSTWTMDHLFEEHGNRGLITVSAAPGGKEVYLCSDGRVYCTSLTYGSEEILSWDHIIDICTAHGFLVGLKSDGTVVISQPQYNQEEAEALAQWTDIVSIRADNRAVLGLRSDGTVCFICPEGHYYPWSGDVEIHEELASWTDISAIELTGEFAAGLKTDGSVVVTAGIRENFDVDVFRGHKIVEIDAKHYDMIGLTEDGRIIRTGVATENIEEVDSWKGIRKP